MIMKKSSVPCKFLEKIMRFNWIWHQSIKWTCWRVHQIWLGVFKGHLSLYRQKQVIQLVHECCDHVKHLMLKHVRSMAKCTCANICTYYLACATEQYFIGCSNATRITTGSWKYCERTGVSFKLIKNLVKQFQTYWFVLDFDEWFIASLLWVKKRMPLKFNTMTKQDNDKWHFHHILPPNPPPLDLLSIMTHDAYPIIPWWWCCSLLHHKTFHCHGKMTMTAMTFLNEDKIVHPQCNKQWHIFLCPLPPSVQNYCRQTFL